MPGGEGADVLPNSSADTSNVRGALFALPPPPPLDIHDFERSRKLEGIWASLEELLDCHEVAPGTRRRTSFNIAYRRLS